MTIEAQLRQVGIATELELLETNTAFGRANAGDIQLFLDGFAWWGDAVDLMRLNLASSEIGSFNFGRYRSAEMDELLRRAREAVSRREHDEALAEAQRLFSRDAVFATIGYWRWGIALRRNVRGAKLWANLPYLDLHDAWIADAP